MPFSIQYSKATGEITATVNSRPADEDLPNGIGQIVFDEWVETNGKMVDQQTMTLTDAPRAEE